MLVVLGPMFFYSEDTFLCDVCSQIVFFPEVLRDPEVWFVVVAIGARLFLTLSVHCESFRLGVVVPVGSDVCVEDL